MNKKAEGWEMNEPEEAGGYPRWRQGQGCLVGLAGPAGAGKTTAARALQAMGFTRLAFADPIKQVLGQLCPGWGESAGTWEHPAKEQVGRYGISPRRAMRVLGEGMRAVDPEIWLVAWAREVRVLAARGIEHVVVDDVRFEAEATLLRDLGGGMVHVRRPGMEFRRDHDTEMGVAVQSELGDVLLHNQGGTESWARWWRLFGEDPWMQGLLVEGAVGDEAAAVTRGGE